MRRLTPWLTACCLLTAALVYTSAGAEETKKVDVGPIIERLVSELPRIRETLDGLENAPDPGMFKLWDKDKDEYRADLDQFLDEAFELLLPGLYGDTRRELAELDAAITLGKQERSELLIEQKMTPAIAGELSLLDRVRGRDVPSDSSEDFKRRIASREREIADLEIMREARIRSFRDSLSKEYGMALSDKEAELALYQVNGEKIVDSFFVVKVLLDVENRLSEIIALKVEGDVAQKYYGVAAVSRLIVARMHARHLASYEDTWLPALDRMEKQNDEALEAGREMLARASSTPRNIPVARKNIEIRGMIAETISQYRSVLVRRQVMTEELSTKAEIDAEVAVQTLRTWEAAEELGSLLGDSYADFAALMELRTPDLVPLDSEAMFERFLDLSRQMQGS